MRSTFKVLSYAKKGSEKPNGNLPLMCRLTVNGEIKQETLLKLFEQHNSEFAKKVGHSRAQGTFQRYETICKQIRDILPHTYKHKDIPLKELNLSFINDFEYFLRTEKQCRTIPFGTT